MNDNGKITLQNDDYYLIKDYKDKDAYRRSLNRLTKKTFGFDFEEWYQQGYWGDKYLPYSLLHGDKVVANVSANPIDFLVNERIIKTVQIGTVMTEEAYRHRGIGRVLIETILKEYENTCDLFYLYANPSVLEFYPKFGFKQAKEYTYTTMARETQHKLGFRKLNLNQEEDKAILTRLAVNTIPVSKYQIVGNPGLLFFYLTSYLSDHIYYSEEAELAAVAEFSKNSMFLNDIFSERQFDLNQVIDSLCKGGGMKVSLGFTPFNTSDFACELYQEEGTTFFVRGSNFADRGRLPVLSHA
jgi:GNAT superfamily N-acetyltransferase